MKLHLLLLIALFGMSMAVSAQRIMKVEKTDGTVVAVPVAEVKRVFFEEEEPDAAVRAGLCPDNHHPHIIDLGLDVKWACCNVGASVPEDYGGYYAWGETKEKDEYKWDTYQYGYYNDDGDYSHLVNIGSDISGTDYDAVTANWGAPWRMPTLDDIEKLLACTSVWTEVNGMYGRKFTGSNGNSIFLPAVGDRWEGYLLNGDLYGLYWSSTISEDSPISAYFLSFSSDNARRRSNVRLYGLPVRPVR